jgi:hypothetical protein
MVVDSVIILLLLAVVAMVDYSRSSTRAAIAAETEKLSREVEQLTADLRDLRINQIEEIRERLLTPKEREQLQWERARDLTIREVERLAPGETASLLMREWMHPFPHGQSTEFEYRHGSIEPTKNSGEWLVKGEWMIPPDPVFRDFSFYASNDECFTTTREGKIKRG